MPIEGLPPLRGWFAAETGDAYQPYEVTICPGTQAANAAAFRALAAPGDPVLIESPTYLGALAAAQAAGLRMVPVPTDADGVRPDLLAEAFRRTGARLFYCQPSHSNPTGSMLSAARRPAVLAAVADAGAFLIENDWAGTSTSAMMRFRRRWPWPTAMGWWTISSCPAFSRRRHCSSSRHRPGRGICAGCASRCARDAMLSHRRCGRISDRIACRTCRLAACISG